MSENATGRTTQQTTADQETAPTTAADAAPTTVVILTEDTLNPADVQHVLGMHPDQVLRYEVLVPADSERNLAVELVDRLSVGELKEAWQALRGEVPSRPEAQREAEDDVDASVRELRAAGREATGVVTEDDPLPALVARVAQGGVLEVIVVTYAHALEDTFHRDWASRARDEIHVPVLHLYTGTSEIG